MSKKELTIILLLALIARLPLLFYPCDVGDSDEYRTIALNIVNHGIFSNSETTPLIPAIHRTPVYPAFVATIYFLFGKSDIPVYIIQLLINVAICFIVYFIALNIFTKRVAFWSSIAVALHPFISWYVTSIMPEMLFTFLLSVTVLLILKAINLESRKLFFSGGIMLGITTLCRPATQFLFLLIILFLFFRCKNKKMFIKLSIIFLFGFVLSLLPWSLRNYKITKEFIPISAEGVGSLYVATLNKEVYDDITQNNCYLAGEKDPLLRRYLLNVQNEPELRKVKKQMWKEAIARIKNNPLQFLSRRLRSQFFLWVGSSYMIKTTWAEAIGKHAYGIIIIKFLITLILHLIPVITYLWAGWLLRKEWQKYLLVYSIPIYFAALHFPIHIEMRYSMPAYPYILIFCVYSVYRIFKIKTA